MKNRKRLLSIVLTLCIILTMMPMTVNAASTVNHIELIGAPDKYKIGETVSDAPVNAISVKSGNVDCMGKMWMNTSTATPSQMSDLGEPLTEDTVFGAFDSSNPKYYFVAVTVMANGGYELADDMTATVNGVDATVIMVYADGVKVAVVLLPYNPETGNSSATTTPPDTKEKVDHIELIGAPDKYKIGETVSDAPVDAISVKSGNVDCMAKMWMNTSTATPSQMSDLGEPLTEDTVFGAFDSSNPKYYFVAVTVMANGGYELADDMTATVNGVDATVIMFYADGVKGAVVLLPYDSETGKLVTNPDLPINPNQPTGSIDPTDPTTPDNTSKPEVDKDADKLPQTGDDSNMMIWFVLMVLAAVTGTVVYKRKRV